MICSSYEPTIGMFTRTVIEDSICARCGEPKASHPTEAATREKFNIEAVCDKYLSRYMNESPPVAVRNAFRDALDEYALSTHQQQGEITEADVKRAHDTLQRFDKYPFDAVILAALSASGK